MENRHKNRLTDMGWCGGEDEMYRVTWKLTLPYVKEIASAVGICYMSQGTQTGSVHQPRGVGWGGRWEGGSRGRGHMYTYG